MQLAPNSHPSKIIVAPVIAARKHLCAVAPRHFSTAPSLSFCLLIILPFFLPAVSILASSSNDSAPLPLELSRFYKAPFVTPTKTNQAFAAICGRQIVDGLPFNIDGEAILYGKTQAQRNLTSKYLPSFTGISIGRKFDELHLIHITKWWDIEGQTIAHIQLNYEDATKAEFPICYGVHVRDWNRLPSEEYDLPTDANTKIFWRGAGSVALKASSRIFKTRFQNPHPEKPVATLEVISTKNLAAYSLLAATVANADPKRPVTPPKAANEPERKFDGNLTVRVADKNTGNPIANALVEPGMVVDDVSVVAAPFRTATNGEGVIRYPKERTKSIFISVKKEDGETQSTSVNIAHNQTDLVEIEFTLPLKITGIVRDPSGAPASNVVILPFPCYDPENRNTKSDTRGYFSLTWNAERYGGSDRPVCLIARDLPRKLAVVQDWDETVTNLDLKLESGVTVSGRVVTAENQPIPNANVSAILMVANRGSSLGSQAYQSDKQGHFEIPCLPPGQTYSIYISAKDYSSGNQQVPSLETETNRIELPPFVLKPADRVLSGVIIDSDEKPVARANIYAHGNGQPNTSTLSDDKGRFSFKVCEGTINLMVNTQNGYANTSAQAGDTNVTITIGKNYSSMPVKPKRSSLKGKPLPDLTTVKLAKDVVPAGQPLLLCLFDCEQRPSRRCLRLLAEQHATLRQKGLAVVAVQAAITPIEAFKSWQDSAPLPFPVGRVAEKSDKTKWAMETESQPWLILVDKGGHVTTEGFPLDDLGEKLKDLGK
jgi:hypothetical protein